MIDYKFSTYAHYMLALLYLFLLSGCTEPAPSGLVAENSGKLTVPHAFLTQRNVNLGNVRAVVEVDGSEIPVTRIGNEWTAEVDVEPGNTVFFAVNWYEMQLATWSSTEVINQNRNFSLTREQYITDFDFDNDGDSNLDERYNETNPLDPASNKFTLPPPSVNVIVSRTDPSRAPTIDGQYRSAEYDEQNAQFADRNNNLLKIDNLMVNEGTTNVLPSRSDGNTEFKWFAIHDGESLFISAVGESVSLATPHSDSGDQAWNDDSIEIFIDTNNDKFTSFGSDDFHFNIPLQTLGGSVNKSKNANSRIWVNSASGSFNENNIEFSTCACQAGQYLWEVRIPLSEFGLLAGVPFGIDVQFNIDHDGGERDTKWGWFHPAGSDTSYMNPSTFGTAFLQ